MFNVDVEQKASTEICSSQHKEGLRQDNTISSPLPFQLIILEFNKKMLTQKCLMIIVMALLVACLNFSVLFLWNLVFYGWTEKMSRVALRQGCVCSAHVYVRSIEEKKTWWLGFDRWEIVVCQLGKVSPYETLCIYFRKFNWLLCLTCWVWGWFIVVNPLEWYP